MNIITFLELLFQLEWRKARQRITKYHRILVVNAREKDKAGRKYEMSKRCLKDKESGKNSSERRLLVKI